MAILALLSGENGVSLGHENPCSARIMALPTLRVAQFAQPIESHLPRGPDLSQSFGQRHPCHLVPRTVACPADVSLWRRAVAPPG